MRFRAPPASFSRVVCLALVISLRIVLPLSAFQISLNGKILSLPNDSVLRSLCYSVPTEKGLERGLALSELLPPLIDTWEIQCTHGKGVFTWKGGGLADEIQTFYLVQSGSDSWDLVARGKRTQTVRSIALKGDKAEEGELEIWLSWEGVRELRAEIERWASLTGVKLRVLEVPDTRSKYLATLRGGGRLPDLLMIQSDNLPDLLSAQAFQALDRIDTTSLSQRGKEAFSVGGRLWALPFYFDTQLLFYNRKLLPSALSENWTLADLEGIADSVAAKGRTPLSWNVYSAYWLVSFAVGFGKPAIADPDGGVRPDDAATKAALEWIMSMIESKRLEALERDAMVARFASGHIAMIFSGSYSIPEFERIGLDFGVAPYPLVPSTGKSVAPLLDFKGFAMSRSSRSPISAQRLLEHLSGIGVQQRFTSALSKLPANEDAWKAAKESNRYYSQLSRSAELGLVLPPSSGYSIYKNIMWKILRFILSKSMGIDQALAEARRLIDANLKSESKLYSGEDGWFPKR